MNAMQHSDNRGLGPASPLFASSWMALFLLLRQELGTRLSTLESDRARSDQEAERESVNRLN